MRVSEERYSRDLRCLDLAARMTRLGARTGHVATWSGLSARRVQHLQTHAVGISGEDGRLRKRGSSPRRLVPMFRTAARRSEAAALVIICGLYGVLPAERGDKAARDLPNVHRGESLCAAFEAYRELVPKPSFTMDHLLLLITALVRRDDIDIERCAHCDVAILAHRWRRDRLLCGACSDSSLQVPVTGADVAGEGLYAPDRAPAIAPLQRSLF